jgi:hypothetical protein
MTDDRTFERLESELRESWLIRGANVIAGASAVWVEQSGTVSALHRLRSAWRSTPADARVRAIATGVAGATLGHVALLQFVPPYIAPAVPELFWVLVAATSLTVAALATQVTHAWSTSVVGRVWRATGWLVPGSRRSARHQAP